MTIIRKFLFLAVGILIAFSVFLIPSIQKVNKIERKVQIKIGNQIILADVALTKREHSKGLSGVMYLEINKGMLFIFEEKAKHTFWMKDMKIPVDIVWLDDKKIVDVNKHVMPEPNKNDSELTIYKPVEPVNKVLEIRGGRFDLFNVKIGDEIKMDSIVPNQSWTGNILKSIQGFFNTEH